MIINGVIMLPIAVLLLVCFVQQIRENIRVSCEDEPKAQEQREIKLITNPHRCAGNIELDGFWDGYLVGNM